MTGRRAFLLLFLAVTRPGAALEERPRWIVVTAPAFREALGPLCERRREEGLEVVVVETGDVLDAAQVAAGDGGPLRERVTEICRKAGGRGHVLLVGVPASPDPARRDTVVPALRGAVGRMEGQPSDNGYGCPGQDLLPTVAVGRFPARTPEEARHMVAKTLAFERDPAPGPWRDRLTLLMGNPGGSTPLEKRFAEWFVATAGRTRFERLHPRWTCRAVIHSSSSAFCVPDRSLREVTLRYLKEGQVFSFYLGHSDASGFWSGGAPFLGREDWAAIEMPAGSGVFFTCGCYGCQLDPGGEGYGLAAIRNRSGPVAVLGAHGESYSAMGQLALDGMMERLAAAEPPERLGDCWLSVKAGLAKGKIDDFTFYLQDQADGSRGKIPQAVQRREHLEMWMLLGDPALRLPAPPRGIRLAVDGPVAAGKTIAVRGELAEAWNGARVQVTLERPPGSPPPDLEPLPEGPPGMRDQAMLRNLARANRVALAACEAEVKEGRFQCPLPLPAGLPWARVIVRARAAAGREEASGVLGLPVTP